MRERNLYQQKLALFVLDMLAFFVALNAAIYLRYSANLPFAKEGFVPWREIFIAFPFVAVVWLVVGATFGSYRIQQSLLQEISAVVRATLITLLAVLSATFFYRGFSYSRGMIGFFIPLVLLAVIGVRLAFRTLRRRVMQRFGGKARIAILGRSPVGDSLVRALLRDRDYYEVVGLIDTDGPAERARRRDATPGGDRAHGKAPAADAGRRASLTVAEARHALAADAAYQGAPAEDAGQRASQMSSIEAVPVLGHVREVEELCAAQRFDSLVLVERNLPEPLVLDSIEACLRHQITWNMVPAVHELLLDRARVDLVDGIPLVGMRRSNIVGFNRLVKRALDVIASLVIILLAAPLMIAVALAIKLSSPGPVFYVQRRVGYRGRVFPFLKFRSMRVNNDDAIHREYTRKWITENEAHTRKGGKEVHKIVHDPRVFPVGRFIRRYSIDELPQLFNVLRGEMSLIGPRPAIPYEVDVYREWHRRRFEAPPGITGLWQVSGRNRLSFEEMIKLDIDYLENWSLLLDLQILWRTVRVVLFEHAY